MLHKPQIVPAPPTNLPFTHLSRNIHPTAVSFVKGAQFSVPLITHQQSLPLSQLACYQSTAPPHIISQHPATHTYCLQEHYSLQPCDMSNHHIILSIHLPLIIYLHSLCHILPNVLLTFCLDHLIAKPISRFLDAFPSSSSPSGQSYRFIHHSIP